MAPLTKDSPEIATNVTEVGPAGPVTQAKPAAGGGLRADALSVEIPVKVHGSKISTAPHGVAPRTEPFEEQTSTMIVFPQGGVIRMSTAVNVGQMLVVTNLKTRQDAICRVVKVRTFTNMQGYVEVEFTHKQEGYWGVQFAGTAKPVVQAAPAVPVAVAPPVSIPAPVAPLIQSAPPAAQVPPATAPVNSVAPVAPPAPAAQTIRVSPLPPPTYVPPPPPAPVAVTPVAPPPYIAPAPPIAPKQETPFVSIGTQEEVQPAASSTSTIKPGAQPLAPRAPAPVRPAPVAESSTLELPKIDLPKIEIPRVEIPATGAPRIETPKVGATVEQTLAPEPAIVSPAPVTSSPAALAPITMSELRGDEPVAMSASATDSPVSPDLEVSTVVEERPAESSRAVFGTLSGGASFGASRSTETPAFGSRLESAVDSPESVAVESRSSNKMLVAVCVGFVLAIVAGGAFYFRLQETGRPAGVQQPPAVTQQALEVATEQSALQNSAARPAVNGPIATVIPSSAPAVTVTANANAASSKPAAPAKAPTSKIAALLNGAEPEHPLTAQRSDIQGADAAPSLDATAATNSAGGDALPGVISSSSLAAPAAPEIRPEGPVVVGGQVKEPRLIYRALPVYPLSAKEAGIGGEVVVKTTIDQKGNVVDTKIVSGPPMLRQSALDALHRWKYEPSKLDGQPIAVQMLVTIKFSR
jgi:protein TonB